MLNQIKTGTKKAYHLTLVHQSNMAGFKPNKINKIIPANVPFLFLMDTIAYIIDAAVISDINDLTNSHRAKIV
jgi:hypothetical protein